MTVSPKIIQGGVDVQTSTGTSALTVDKTSGAATTLGLTASNAGNSAPIQSRYNASNAPMVMNYYCTNGNPYIGWNTVQTASSDNQTYAVNNYAGKFTLTGTGIEVWTAGSGVAGNTITWVKAATFDQTGAGTFGPSSGLTTSHVIQNSSTAGGASVTTLKKLAVNVNGNNTYYVEFLGANGTEGYIQTNGSAVLTLVDSSDFRWKENIRNASYGIETIKALRPVEFDWKSGVKNVKGFIAQEVKEVLPESVNIRDESEAGGFADAHYLETQTMIPVLVKAVQELSAQVEELKAEVAALKGQ